MQYANAHILRTIQHFIRIEFLYKLTRKEQRIMNACYHSLESDQAKREAQQIATLQFSTPPSLLSYSNMRYVHVFESGQMVCTNCPPDDLVWRWPGSAINPLSPKYHHEADPIYRRPIILKQDMTQNIPVINVAPNEGHPLDPLLDIPCFCMVLIDLALNAPTIPVNTITFSRN